MISAMLVVARNRHARPTVAGFTHDDIIFLYVDQQPRPTPKKTGKKIPTALAEKETQNGGFGPKRFNPAPNHKKESDSLTQTCLYANIIIVCRAVKIRHFILFFTAWQD
ncbi:hypothetical protein KJ866_04195 [Patescibacteria group bacterium]|nr:hypothetical protein [Patescibacteria group bacterium]MBU2219543.1 hypothetical protein [Patescibacteria group bacterium]MBU2265243.1 hypothetical protein [Patescibacteria group bacterium]